MDIVKFQPFWYLSCKGPNYVESSVLCSSYKGRHVVYCPFAIILEIKMDVRLTLSWN